MSVKPSLFVFCYLFAFIYLFIYLIYYRSVHYSINYFSLLFRIWIFFLPEKSS